MRTILLLFAVCAFSFLSSCQKGSQSSHVKEDYEDETCEEKCTEESIEEFIISKVETKIDSTIARLSVSNPEIKITKELVSKSKPLLTEGDPTKNQYLCEKYPEFLEVSKHFIESDAIGRTSWSKAMKLAIKMDEANKKYNNNPTVYRMFFIYEMTLSPASEEEYPFERSYMHYLYVDYDVRTRSISDLMELKQN